MYKPVALKGLGVTGLESNWRKAVIDAVKRRFPDLKDKTLGLTKKNNAVNVFIVGNTFKNDKGDIQKGRFLVYREVTK